MSSYRADKMALLPAYNEEAAIAKLVLSAQKHVDAVVVVDDGSTDMTAAIAEKLGATVLRHERNLGKGAALATGFRYAKQSRVDILVTLDSDGQHDPNAIPNLLQPILEGRADVVIGSRRFGHDIPKFRRFGGKLLDHATGVRVNGQLVDSQSGFRAYSRKALERTTAAEYGMGVDSEILMKANEEGLRIVEVPVAVTYEGSNTSTHNPAFHALDVLFSAVKFISIRHPFVFYGGFSAIMFLIALIFGVQTLDYYAKWGRVVTNLALVSVAAGILAFLALFTAIILFTLITVLREKR
jgi:glycosyltransferase involved in cell wall biosynthesis